MSEMFTTSEEEDSQLKVSKNICWNINLEPEYCLPVESNTAESRDEGLNENITNAWFLFVSQEIEKRQKDS